MKTLKIGKKEFTALTDHEMCQLRYALCGLMSHADFAEEHLIRALYLHEIINIDKMIETPEDFKRMKVMSNVKSGRDGVRLVRERCEAILKMLRES